MDKAPDLSPGDAGSNPALINVFLGLWNMDKGYSKYLLLA
jgi:hypothetical protein